jgi:hypothetical protein
MDHLRTLDPDAVDRLTAAVTGVGLAVRDLLAADGRTAPPGPGGAPPGAEAGGDAEGGAEDEAGVDRVPVRRIDVTE